VQEIPATILQRFDEIYQFLEHEIQHIAMPSRDSILDIVKRCSFRMFDENDEYFQCKRAQNFPHFISPTRHSRIRPVFQM
jgi:hypothetical protein